MKLLNREPTEEMVRAAGRHYESDEFTGAWSTFKAMYDAAPELTVDMEPIGHVDDIDEMYLTLDDSVKTGDDFYSTEQLATLQAENERLRKEVEELKELLAGEPQH